MSTTTIIEQLVGVRFAVDAYALADGTDTLVGQLGLRPGPGGHLVADATPVAGPVYLVDDAGTLRAWCRGCGETSSGYKARVPGLDAWADEHTCAPLVLGS